ncbi:MAG: hypothetical protein Q8M54_07500 [Desulfobaccales bacterium]|nr:hypothetical protein [Desulfobaccales bacterium]
MPRIITNSCRLLSGNHDKNLPLPLARQGRGNDEQVKARRAVPLQIRFYPTPPLREN